jgi:hypothetical protein
MAQHNTLLSAPHEHAEALAAGVTSAVLSLKQYLDRLPATDFSHVEADIDEAIDLLTDAALIASFHRRMREVEPQVMQMLADKVSRVTIVNNHAERIRLRDALEPIMHAAALDAAFAAQSLETDRLTWLAGADGADAEESFFDRWLS